MGLVVIRDTNWRTEKFDVDLEFGKGGEAKLKELFSRGDKLEIKTERDIWASTGNIAVEIECRDELSGISTTEADYWVQQLSKDGEIVGLFILPVPEFKKRISMLVDSGEARIVMGGDYNASKLVLVPIARIFV